MSARRPSRRGRSDASAFASRRLALLEAFSRICAVETRLPPEASKRADEAAEARCCRASSEYSLGAREWRSETERKTPPTETVNRPLLPARPPPLQKSLGFADANAASLKPAVSFTRHNFQAGRHGGVEDVQKVVAEEDGGQTHQDYHRRRQRPVPSRTQMPGLGVLAFACS